MRLTRFLLWAVVWACAANAQAMKITSLYSPRNAERQARSRTDYIILHTTEAPKGSALRKLRQNGEAHYFVDEEGHIYRLVHHARIAYHAGRSMWEGRTNLDTCSIGIEVVGYHDRNITSAQYTALHKLIDELQRMYRIPDERVLTHSMVAYGTPNRWHERSHRGRKRCAMNLGTRASRQRMGLKKAPAFDPDVRAGRLVVGDPYLTSVLYASAAAAPASAAPAPKAPAAAGSGDLIAAGRSAWDIARDRYASRDTLYVLPGGKMLRGDQITDWKAIPAGTRVVLSAEYRDNPPDAVGTVGGGGPSARDVAGAEYRRPTTLYFLPDGAIRRGDEFSDDELARLPPATRVLIGYTQGGEITARRSAFDVCGARWNHASTFYRFPDGSLKSGDTIRENAIPRGTHVFFQK